MCFRPSTTIKPKKCPVCSCLNSSIAKKCIKCKTDLVAYNKAIKIEEKKYEPLTDTKR